MSKPIGDIARRYAREYGADPNTVLAAAEAVLSILRAEAAEGSQLSVERRDDADTLRGIGCPACGTILNAKVADCSDPWHHDNRAPAEESVSRACAAVSWPSDEAVRSGRFGPCVLTEHQTNRGHAEVYTLHRDGHGNEWTSASPADGSVSVPPPVDRPLATGGIIASPPLLLVDEGGCALTDPPAADEPGVEPPPVDALLKLIDRASFCHTCDNPTINPFDEDEIETAVRAMYQSTADAQQARDKQAYEREVAAYNRGFNAGCSPTDKAKIDAARAAGVAEGRRLEREDRDNDVMEATTRD